MRTAALLVALAMVLSGCLGAEEAPEPEGPDADAGAASAHDAAVHLDGANATAPADMTGGHAPHIHNYWGDSDRIVIFDGATNVEVQDRWTMFNLFLEKRPALGGDYFELPDGATIYEGTGQLVITASWTEPTITGLAIRYHSPDMPSGFTSWSSWMELAPGAPLTIDVKPEMTDMPHDAKSRWSFQLAAGGSAGVAQGEVGLVFEIVRMRDVMTFPGHPDMYEDTDRYLLADEEFHSKGSGRLVWFANALAGTPTSGDTYYLPKAVPMETRALLVTVKLLSGGTTSPLAQQTGVGLQYTSAETRWDYDAQLLESTEDTYVFGIPVDDSMVDTPYREGSAWHLHVRPTQKTTVPLSRDPEGCDGCVEFEMQVHLKVEAFDRDPTGGTIEPRPQRG